MTSASPRPRLASVLAILILCGIGCAKTPKATPSGCVCQGTGVLEEIASGRFEECSPETAAWEREWYRDCRHICDPGAE